MKIPKILLAALLGLACVHAGFGQSSVSLVKTRPSSGQTLFSDTVGFKFTVGSKPLKVSALGVARGNELFSANQVGLWNEEGQLIASATIPLNATLENGYLWQTLSSEVTLAASTSYTIAACGSNYNSEYRYNGALELSSDVSLVGFARNSQRWVFSKPSLIGINGQGAVGANFKYTVPTGSLDSDGDGVNDYREGKDGTDPTNATSFDPLSKGLVAIYPFEVNTEDESGFFHNGTANGTKHLLNSSYNFSNCYEFNGVDSFIKIPNSLGESESGTISVWFSAKSWAPSTHGKYLFSISQSQPLTLTTETSTVGSGDWVNLGIHPDSTGNSNLLFGVWSNAGWQWADSDSAATAAGWQNLAGVFNKNSISIYLNGIKKAEIPNNGYPVTASRLFTIGASAWSGTGFNGTIDNVRVYNRALGVEEVAQIYLRESYATNVPISRGNSLYTLVDGLSWMHAEANALKLGGHLAAITSIEENQFIISNFSVIYPNIAYIGHNDINLEGSWLLPDSTKAHYFNWAQGEPNNSFGITEEDVAAIYLRLQDYGALGVWNDVPIDGSGNISAGIAEIPFIRRGNSAYVIVQGSTWVEAEANAQKLGGHLVTINDSAENQWLFETFKISGTIGDFSNTYWAGFNDLEQEGAWEWSSGETSNYTNWATSEPSGPDDYLVLGRYGNGGTWNDATYEATKGIAEIQIIEASLTEMIPVQGGTLPTGSGLAGQAVGDFQIGKYEVTWGEWKTVREWAVANGYTDLANVGDGSADGHPVRNVSWLDALKWCNAKSEMEGLALVYKTGGETFKLGQNPPVVASNANGYRLPLEKEWEWAARGGTLTQGFIYSGSNDLNSVSWNMANSMGAPVDLIGDGRGTWPAGLKLPNELGLFDMSGNVFEWCWDSHDSYLRRLRGGGFWVWGYNGVADQYWSGLDDRNVALGFRLARNAAGSIQPATPTVTTLPTASVLVFGQALSNSTLTGGVAGVNGTTVAGSFAFALPSTVPTVGNSTHQVVFTPSDSVNYTTTTANVTVTVSKAGAVISTLPSASSITFGQALSSSVLTGGAANVAGSFAFASPSAKPAAGNSTQGVVFTPSDSGNYTSATANVTVVVNKASQGIGAFDAIGDKRPGDLFQVRIPAASSGLSVALSVKSGPAAVSGNTVTVTGGGMVVLAANQSGDANRLAAPEVTVSFRSVQSEVDWLEKVPKTRRFSMTLYASINDGRVSAGHSSSVLAAFDAAGVSGAAQPISHKGRVLFNLTAWSDSNRPDAVDLRFYDGASGKVYFVNEAVRFSNDAVIGDLEKPVSLTLAYEEMEQVIGIGEGWNWISFSVLPLGGEVSDVFSGYLARDNDLIKGPQGLATAFRGQWFPPNFVIEPGKMYVLRRQAGGQAQVRVLGGAQSASTGIGLVAGWNWVGYIPQEARTVATALARLKAGKGDVLKSQIFGSLMHSDGKWLPAGSSMEPGRGYMLRVQKPQTFSYDAPVGNPTAPGPRPVLSRKSESTGGWAVPQGKPSSMVVYAKVVLGGKAAEAAGSQLAAFEGSEVAGVTGIEEGPEGGKVYQLLVHSNSAGGAKIGFQVREGGAAVALKETVSFEPDGVLGSLEKPLTLTGERPVAVAAPRISGNLSVRGNVGAAFSYRITASNNATSYGAQGLPAGLTLNAKTGVISGRPTSAGNSTVTLRAGNAGGNGTAKLAIRVLPALAAITSSAVVEARVGVAFSHRVTASNNAKRFTAQGLPAGLTLNEKTGVISGRVSKAGNSQVTIAAINAGGTTTATLTIRATRGK